MNLLVIGYGNPLRGDDGFGYRAAERIAGALAVQQLTPELMEPISRADRVLFLDAGTEGAPGEIRRRAIVPLERAQAFTHHTTPDGLLAGAQTLYGRAPEAEVITVCGANFGMGETLSPCIQAALDQVSDILLNAETRRRGDHAENAEKNSKRIPPRPPRILRASAVKWKATAPATPPPPADI